MALVQPPRVGYREARRDAAERLPGPGPREWERVGHQTVTWGPNERT